MRRTITAFLLASTFTVPAAAETIGQVNELLLGAYGTPPGAKAVSLYRWDDVVGDEEISTVENGAIKITFIDGTKLTMGGSARMVLDKLVYDPQNKGGAPALAFAAGAFRYVSGSAKNQDMRLKTPVAALGIRGTEFTVVVNPADGATTINMRDGAAVVSANADNRTAVVSAGQTITVTRAGLGEVGAMPSLGAGFTGDAGVDNDISQDALSPRRSNSRDAHGSEGQDH